MYLSKLAAAGFEGLLSRPFKIAVPRFPVELSDGVVELVRCALYRSPRLITLIWTYLDVDVSLASTENWFGNRTVLQFLFHLPGIDSCAVKADAVRGGTVLRFTSRHRLHTRLAVYVMNAPSGVAAME